MPADQGERRLVVRSEPESVRGFREEHPIGLSPADHGGGQLALRLGQARQGDVAIRVHPGRSPNRRRHAASPAHVAQPHRMSADRGDADHAFAQRHLRPRAADRIPPTGQGGQAAFGRVHGENHRTGEAEIGDQALKGAIHHGVGVAFGADGGAQARGLGQPFLGPQMELGRRGEGRGRRSRQRTASLDAIELGAPEAHDLAGALLAADGAQLRGHAVEQVAFDQRGFMDEIQRELCAGAAAHDDDRRAPGSLHVRGCLREELVGQGDVAVVDQIDLGQVGHVRHALGVQGRHDRGNDAFEAVANAGQCDHDRAADS
ncbi:hypothetical protein D3C85_735940 [compost metagenome]